MENEERALSAVDVPAIADDQLIKVAQQAERRIDAVMKIKKVALKVTNRHDWVSQNDRPYLQASGGEKIARLFGISWRIDEPVCEESQDGHFAYTYKGYFTLGGVTIEAIGTRSSKDGFFKRYEWAKDADGKDQRTTLPPSEIDRGDVKKSAYTNLIGNGITRMLGIRNLTWEDLKEFAGITKDAVGKVDYQKGDEESTESKDRREEIRRMVLEIAGGDSDKAKTLLEGFTSFVPKGKSEADRVKGKSHVKDLTEKQLQPTYGRVKERYEAWKKEGDKEERQPGEEG